MPSPPSRLTWLDLFRGACVVGMIETHVLNTFLVSSSRETAWFAWLTYFDGLIAPAFLFIAGYAQGLGMRRSEAWRDTLRRVPDRKDEGSAERSPPPSPAEVWDATERVPPSAGAHTSRAFGRKLRRLAEIWLLGYALHFPAPQLLAGQWSEALRLGTQVDVLQCLAVSLALLLAIERLAGRSMQIIVTFLIPLTFLASEAVAEFPFEPDWLRAYFTSDTGSLFPLLPWAAFVFVGFLASSVIRWVSWKSTLQWALLVAFALAVGGSKGFFAQRVAWLLLAVPLVQGIAARWQPQWLLFVGKESLVIYAAHLLLIEALASFALQRSGYSLANCGWIFAAVLGASLLIAVLWGRARRAGRRRGNSARAA